MGSKPNKSIQSTPNQLNCDEVLKLVYKGNNTLDILDYLKTIPVDQIFIQEKLAEQQSINKQWSKLRKCFKNIQICDNFQTQDCTILKYNERSISEFRVNCSLFHQLITQQPEILQCTQTKQQMKNHVYKNYITRTKKYLKCNNSAYTQIQNLLNCEITTKFQQQQCGCNGSKLIKLIQGIVYAAINHCKIVSYMIGLINNNYIQTTLYSQLWQQYCEQMVHLVQYQQYFTDLADIYISVAKPNDIIELPFSVELVMARIWGQAFQEIVPKMEYNFIQQLTDYRISPDNIKLCNTFIQSIIDIYSDQQTCLSYGHSSAILNRNMKILTLQMQQSTENVYIHWKGLELHLLLEKYKQDIQTMRQLLPPWICQTYVAQLGLTYIKPIISVSLLLLTQDRLIELRDQTVNIITNQELDQLDEYDRMRIRLYDFHTIFDQLCTPQYVHIIKQEQTNTLKQHSINKNTISANTQCSNNTNNSRILCDNEYPNKYNRAYSIESIIEEDEELPNNLAQYIILFCLAQSRVEDMENRIVQHHPLQYVKLDALDSQLFMKVIQLKYNYDESIKQQLSFNLFDSGNSLAHELHKQQL